MLTNAIMIAGWCGRERDGLSTEAEKARTAAASATAELQRLRSLMAEAEQRAGLQVKDLQGKVKAAEAALR